MDALVAIKMMIPRDLIENVQTAIVRKGMSQTDFFVEAAKKELVCMQESRIREEIALIEINNDILADGESVNIVAEEGKSGPESLFEQCEMCHDILSAPARQIEGPFFCSRCLGIAKGANFRGLQP